MTGKIFVLSKTVEEMTNCFTSYTNEMCIMYGKC